LAQNKLHPSSNQATETGFKKIASGLIAFPVPDVDGCGKKTGKRHIQ
jgi:hypothetical protein